MSDLGFGTEAPDAPPDSALAYTVYLIGDAGAPRADGVEPTLALLKDHLAAASERTAVVFLGDNIYPSGLPPRSSPARPEAERRLRAQLEATEGFAGRIVFLPGNHDYGDRGLGGNPAAVRRQERFVQEVLGRGNTYLPDGAFPGPAEVELADSLTLVVLNTQWWLEDDRRYGDTGDFIVEQAVGVVVALEDVLRRRRDDRLLVVGHHPFYTNGEHAGRYPRRNYLPVPLSRRYLGTPQDLSNRKYRIMIEALSGVFEQHDGLIYAAGHEHTLQYFPIGEQHYIVSGAGSKSSYVAEGGRAAFVDEGKGFGRLRYYTDGSVWLDFWKPGEDGGRRVYLRRLEPPTGPLVAAPAPALAEEPAAPSMPESTNGKTVTPTDDPYPYAFAVLDSVTVPASRQYDAGPLKSFLLGEHYRDVWSTPARIPVIDLGTTAGGLRPIKRGGSFQTISLRLQGADGDQYVLRSVDKFPSKAVPRTLRRTVAQDLVQDQISAMHPYGAFVVPKLAEAGGVYHTAPRLVYVPSDRRLGIYRDDMAGQVALFESRPDEDQRDEARFGRAENIIGTEKLFEEITEDNDHRVDEPAFVRARLLDMLIGDVDRHRDQWRWSAFEPHEVDPTLHGEARTQGKVYRAIPRDRDFAFYHLDGPLTVFIRAFGNRQTERFNNRYGPSFGSIRRLNSAGSTLDRRFTAEMTREDWVAQAESLQVGITDAVIEEAVRQMPASAYALTGQKLVDGLKARRDALPEAAARYYEMLAKTVDVVGSEKHERFTVTHHPDGRTEVVMTKMTEEGEAVMELYRRRFDPGETDEVRLYGLDGDDTFVFEGERRGRITVRAVGGEGNDTFRDASETGRASARTVLYDTPEGNTWAVGRGADVVRTRDPRLLRYEPEPLLFDEFGPTTSFAYNSDDGVFAGAGIEWIRQGFKKTPYAQRHLVFANYAVRTDAYNVGYDGVFPQIAGRWEGRLRAGAFVTNDFNQFYGLGNETENTQAVRDRFRAKLRQVRVEPSLRKELPWFRKISFEPYFTYTDVEPPDDLRGVETQPPSGFDRDDFLDTYYAGFRARFDVDGTDTLAATQSGARWLNGVSVNRGVRNSDKTFATLASELSYFYTFDVPRPLTLALRVGGATNIGPFEFYQANTLGGQTNLRGYPRTRFAGHSSLFTNAELRAELFDFNAYLTRGNGGVLVFADQGRVWVRGEDSRTWHRGAGGGVWISPFYRAVITATLGFSDEESALLDLSIGFLF